MSTIQSNRHQAIEDKKKVKKKLNGKYHDTREMYGVKIIAPKSIAAEYYAPTKERLKNTISRLKQKALDARELHEFKSILIPRKR